MKLKNAPDLGAFGASPERTFDLREQFAKREEQIRRGRRSPQDSLESNGLYYMPEVGSELRISVDHHTRYHSPSGEYVVVRLFDAPEFGTHRSDMGFDASVLSISYENGETENFLAVKLPAYFNTKSLGKGKASKEQAERFMRNVSVMETAGAPENLRVEEMGGRYSVEIDEASVRLTSEPGEAADFADFD